MIMRWFKTFNKKVKASFDTEGVTLVYSDGQELTPSDISRFGDVFRMWTLYYVDARACLDEPSALSAVHPFRWVWALLRSGYPVDYLFEVLERLLLLTRGEKPLSEYRTVLKEYPYLGEALVPILVPLLRLRRQPDGFMQLHGLLMFMANMCLDRESLVTDAYHSWLSNESRLIGLSDFDYLDDDALALRDIIAEVLAWWSPSLMEEGSFTNGSTADAGKDIFEKIYHPAITTELATLLVRDRPDLLSDPTVRFIVVPGYRFWSKYVLVPKSWKARRAISMECAALNYWQFSFDESLRRALRKSWFGGIYTPDDQSRNRRMAIAGSADGSLATLDLSAASDSVRIDHVYGLFPRRIVEWLLALRSDYVVFPDDSGLDARGQWKYAPMGSRITFDLESIIFGSIAVLATRRFSNSKVMESVSVYGDDIIVPTDAVHETIRLLEKFGFAVNTAKSFQSGGFRESCGVFAYKGVDVSTPHLPRRRFSPMSEMDASSAAWVAMLANRSYYLGYALLRYYLVDCLRQYGEPVFRQATIADAATTLEGTSDGEAVPRYNFSVVSDSPTNYRARHRKSPVSQPDYGLGQRLHLSGISSGLVNRERDDDAAYVVWQYYARRRNLDAELSSDVLIASRSQCQVETRLGTRWVSIPG